MATRSWIALGLLVAVGAGMVVLDGVPSRADDADSPHTAYLSVTGEGPNAKGWYRGAPPAGVPVQEALDHFSEQGYRVKGFRSTERPVVITGSGSSGDTGIRNEYVVLLEK